MAIYEQDEASTLRQGLWRLLWFVVIAVALWLLVWLIFFRSTPPKVSNTSNSGNNTKKTQPASDKQKTPGGSGTSPGTTPDELANTGAGNVIIPFAAATVAGTVFYHIRLRRKLAAQVVSAGR